MTIEIQTVEFLDTPHHGRHPRPPGARRRGTPNPPPRQNLPHEAARNHRGVQTLLLGHQEGGLHPGQQEQELQLGLHEVPADASDTQEEAGHHHVHPQAPGALQGYAEAADGHTAQYQTQS